MTRSLFGLALITVLLLTLAQPMPPGVCHAFAALPVQAVSLQSSRAAKACHPAETAFPEALTLEERLAPLAKAHKGKVALAVKHLETGESYYLNADEVMPTASLIKVAVMIEVYQQLDEGKLKLTDRLTLRDADKVPGSGILNYHFSEGATFPLRDGVRLMIALSDNTATNLVLEQTGIAAVNKRMEAWGFPNTKINAKVFRGSTTSVDPERTKRYGLGSTTAREMAGLFEELQIGERNRPVLKQCMLGHLKKNEDKDKFTRLLPPGTVVAHKDGAVNDARTDAGILYTPGGAVAVCVLTNGNEDQRWQSDNAGNVLCAKVAKEVYDHFRDREKK
jgi:beta-lactamase class A